MVPQKPKDSKELHTTRHHSLQRAARQQRSKSGIIFDLLLVPEEKSPWVVQIAALPCAMSGWMSQESRTVRCMRDNSTEAQYLLVTSLGYAVLYLLCFRSPMEHKGHGFLRSSILITFRVLRKREIALQFSTLFRPCFTNAPSKGKEFSTC